MINNFHYYKIQGFYLKMKKQLSLYLPAAFIYSCYKTLNKSIHILLIFLITLGCSVDRKKDGSTVKKVLNNINGEPVVPRDANRIIIPFFHNYTKEPSISEKLTLRLRKLISMDGRLAVVSKNDKADLRLAGMVVRYQIQPVQYGNFHEPIRKRLRIVASVRLLDMNKKREIFYGGEIQAFEVYSEVIPPITSEIQIQDMVLENLARRISNKVINGWYTDLMTPIEKGKL